MAAFDVKCPRCKRMAGPAGPNWAAVAACLALLLIVIIACAAWAIRHKPAPRTASVAPEALDAGPKLGPALDQKPTTSSSPAPTPAPSIAPIPTQGQLRLVSWQITEGDLIRYISGSVVNETGRQVNATISFALHDASGAQLGNASDNGSNLSPGEVWHFKAPVWEQSAADFRLANLSWY